MKSKRRGFGPSLAFFGVQVCYGGKIKRRIEIITSLESPNLEIALKTGFVSAFGYDFLS